MESENENENDNLGLNLRALGLTGKAKPGRKSERNKTKKLERQRVDRTALKRGVTRNANERRQRAKAERNAAVQRRRAAANFRGNLQHITGRLGGIGLSEPAAAYPSGLSFSALPSFSLAAPTFTGAPAAAAAYVPAYEPAGFSLAPPIFTGPALSPEEREAARRLRIQELGLEHAEGEGEGEDQDENNGPGEEWGGEERTGGGLFQRIKALETLDELNELEDELSESALADPSIKKALKKQKQRIDAAEKEQKKAEAKFAKNTKKIRRTLNSRRKGRPNTGSLYGYTLANPATRRAKMNVAREGRAIEEREWEEAVIAEEKRARKENRRAAAAEEDELARMFKGLMKEGGRRKRRTLRKKRGPRRSSRSRR